MEELNKNQEIEKTLMTKKKNIFEISSESEIKDIFNYAEGYKSFLNESKTEREAVKYAISRAVSLGYSEYKFGDKLSFGDKKYYNNRGKSVYLFKIGKEDIEKDGVRIIAAHIDSPRIDLKQNPVYEDSSMAFFKTHYYGGIKKYQWTALPLALHGVIVRADGTSVDIKIGEDENDPVFYINDLLPHLAQNQMQETMAKAIPGENLNILVGAMPINDEKIENKIKFTVIRILNDKYGITEDDFVSAEISAVPAFKARDIGFDRALVGSYGHDDRVCAYPAMTALFDSDSDSHTVLTILADKEEIGSEGNTGMQSRLLCDMIEQISLALGKNPVSVRANSKCLSADVNAAYDPNFAEVYEKKNSAMLSYGATMSKYTGSRGKSGTSDASAEFVGYVRKLFNDAGVVWQTSELGKVDIGGGGTVAMYIANLNIDTVDIGVPVISMHAPYEVISKADLYSTYKAFLAFCK
ncbi:MAG: aminopeptidase [Eubacteriales bacterium]|nr:aminopeptidase [Eubacteriales bacterium]